MKRLQFSIVTLLGALTLAALGCAALVNASAVWANIVVSSVVLALLTATVGAVYSSSRRRVKCGGFAIFGWAYLLLATSSLFEVNQYFLTATALDVLYGALAPNSVAPSPAYAISNGQPLVYQTALAAANSGQSPPSLHPAATLYSSPTRIAITLAAAPNFLPHTEFHRIGHALWTVLIGASGGVIAGCFAARPGEVGNAPRN